MWKNPEKMIKLSLYLVLDLWILKTDFIIKYLKETIIPVNMSGKAETYENTNIYGKTL